MACPKSILQTWGISQQIPIPFGEQTLLYQQLLCVLLLQPVLLLWSLPNPDNLPSQWPGPHKYHKILCPTSYHLGTVSQTSIVQALWPPL